MKHLVLVLTFIAFAAFLIALMGHEISVWAGIALVFAVVAGLLHKIGEWRKK